MPGGAGSFTERLISARRRATRGPAAGEDAGMSAVIDGTEQRLSRVAALGRTAQLTLRQGRAADCLATLAQQRAAAGQHNAAVVWALTSASACRAVLGQVRRARADLAQARQACRATAAPGLAEPFWRFTEIVCNWLAGDWEAAQATAAAALDLSWVSPMTPGLAVTVTALRTELARGLGLQRETRLLAEQLAAAPPAEMSAWALAGVDAEQGHLADAMRRLTDVCHPGQGSVNKAALPYVLHRMAETAFSRGDQGTAVRAAAALAGLDQAAPLTEILAGLARTYATGDPHPARHAQRRAEAEGAGALVAEALTVRGRVGDEPATTLLAAHAAWHRIGAAGKARAVTAAIRSAGLPAPAVKDLKVGRRRRPADPAALTTRERTLARLVHDGRTNQQIASMLHISVKTVEACLTRVYRKTSCSSRVELAVAVTERRVNVGEPFG